MTIKMRLDTDGLRALIKDNPELELEIGREVLKNIQDDAILTKIEAKINGKIDAFLASLVVRGGSWNQPTYTLHPSFDRIVNDLVAQAVAAKVDAQFNAVISDRVGAALVVERKKLQEGLRDLLREMVTPEMAKEIVREKLLL